MKNILSIIIALNALNLFSCQCVGGTNVDKSFLTSDFVAKVKILNKYENLNDSNFFKVDIEIIDLYKGKSVKSIWVYGHYKHRTDSSCGKYIKTNENLLLYASLDANKENKIYGCTRLIHLDNLSTIRYPFGMKKIYDREISILTTLKNNKINYSNSGKITGGTSLYPYLTKINTDLNKKKNNKKIDDFGVFEFVIGKNFTTTQVKVIKGFNNKLNRKIKKMIKQMKWTEEYSLENNITKGIKSFMSINYRSYKNNKIIISPVSIY